MPTFRNPKPERRMPMSKDFPSLPLTPDRLTFLGQMFHELVKLGGLAAYSPPYMDFAATLQGVQDEVEKLGAANDKSKQLASAAAADTLKAVKEEVPRPARRRRSSAAAP